MATTDLDFADLDELATLLRAGGIASVDVDPSKVRAPGVWIAPRSVALDNLAGVTIRVELHAVVPSVDTTRDLAALADLFNQIKAVLDANGIGGPDADTRVVGVTFPGSSSPLPALAIPLDLYTTKE